MLSDLFILQVPTPLIKLVEHRQLSFVGDIRYVLGVFGIEYWDMELGEGLYLQMGYWVIVV